VHPNDNGYAKMAVVWYNALVNYFDRTDLIISGSTGVGGVSLGGLDVISDSNGNYIATVCYGWSGTVIPSKAGYTFSPPAMSYVNITMNQMSQNYTATLNTYTITASAGANGSIDPAGEITRGYGSSQLFTATPDINYEVDKWSVDSVEVQTGGTEYTISNITAAHTLSVTFSRIAILIGGCVLEPDEVTPIEGVLVTADNGGGSDITDPNGYYELTVDYGWSGVVDPNASGYTFDPNNLTYTNVVSNLTDQTFTGSPEAFIISGTIRDGVTPIEGVTVTPENGGGYFTNKYNGGGSDKTDPNGLYEVMVDYNWSGTVTPTHNIYTFAPLSNSYSNVISDIADQDYAGTMLPFSVSGYIRNILDVPAEGVSVTAQNGGGTDTTDTVGYYKVGVSYGWTGSVTAAKMDYTFTPSEAPYVNVTANLTGDFLAKLDADINGDGHVDGSDLLIMAVNWLMPGDLNTGNLNGDAIVDMQDVAELSEYWMD
jgi:hypothetical protein